MTDTIQLDKKVRDKLRRLKIHPRESYNNVLSDETMRDIEKSLEDVRAGRIFTMKQVKKRLKMK